MPTVLVIGMIDNISGGGGVTVKIFAPITDGLANPPGVVTATVRATWGAVNAIEIDTVTEFPSGDTEGAPFIVIPVFGWKATDVAPPRLAPFMVTSRLDDPMAPLFGLMDVMVGPKAIPTGAACTGPKVLDDEGGGGASSLTPTIGDRIGSLATSLGGLGGVFRTIPTWGAYTKLAPTRGPAVFIVADALPVPVDAVMVVNPGVFPVMVTVAWVSPAGMITWAGLAVAILTSFIFMVMVVGKMSGLLKAMVIVPVPPFGCITFIDGEMVGIGDGG